MHVESVPTTCRHRVACASSMSRPANLLSDQAYNELFDYLYSHDADKFGVPYDERIKAIENNENAALSRSTGDRVYSLSLNNLPVFLRPTGMKIRDVYSEVWHNPLTWPDEQCKRVAETLDKICENRNNEPFVNQLCLNIRQYIADWWDEDRASTTNLSIFLKCCFLKRVSLDGRSSLPQDVQDTLQRITTKTNRADHIEAIRLCNVLYIPFHWAMCYAPNVLILGNSPFTETFMDDYIRLSETHRNHFEALVNAAAASLGVE